MDGVVLRPGRASRSSAGGSCSSRAFEQLTITESHFPDARDGREPALPPPPRGLVLRARGWHGRARARRGEAARRQVRSPARRRRSCTASARRRARVFLNFHTPDGGFADNLRARNRGEEGGFDSVDAPPGSGKPPDGRAVFLAARRGRAARGEQPRRDDQGRTRGAGADRVRAASRVSRAPTRTRTTTTSTRSTSSKARPTSSSATRWLRLPARLVRRGADSASCTRSRTRDGQHARLLNIHAPSTGFHDATPRVS